MPIILTFQAMHQAHAANVGYNFIRAEELLNHHKQRHIC